MRFIRPPVYMVDVNFISKEEDSVIRYKMMNVFQISHIPKIILINQHHFCLILNFDKTANNKTVIVNAAQY